MGDDDLQDFQTHVKGFAVNMPVNEMDEESKMELKKLVGNDVEVDKIDFVTRYFSPWNGIKEDPVNGSSQTSLCPYYSNKLGKQKLVQKYSHFLGTITANHPIDMFKLVTERENFRYLSKQYFPMIPDEIDYTNGLTEESYRVSEVHSEIIQSMKKRIQELESILFNLNQQTSSVTLLMGMDEKNQQYSAQFKMLREMGFFDQNRWIQILDQCNGDIQKALISIYIEHFQTNNN
ncbi:hypothetical protein C9374_014377 [Naegleria lovaniensis]|uniref:UBA domain-containing protein n=1 Tax=Naegleria lovaniensis TaxID=51637 RepID=A0AA88KU45_NAELO|nr:uncharacterized protein C9374_014377 [Naegleria lovaniensis]KAG2388977.1 hypothetical protein C9374_014377 [Naegleria lovaniensis]